MTQLEFWGCGLITFGPAVAMFALTVAHDPIKVILLITSSFFWLLSFLTVAICWSVISKFSDYLIIGATLAVLSQEVFRYLFHRAAKRAQRYLTKLLCTDIDNSKTSNRSSEIQLSQPDPSEIQGTIPFSYGEYTGVIPLSIDSHILIIILMDISIKQSQDWVLAWSMPRSHWWMPWQITPVQVQSASKGTRATFY